MNTLAITPQAIGMTEGQQDGLQALIGGLLQANKTVNLTAIRDAGQAWEKHILDSLAPLCVEGLIPKGASCIDIGTGAGFPGLPLALMRPDTKWVLLDSTKKKLAFAQSAADMLGLAGVEVCHGRAEELGRTARREGFTLACARAVARLDILAEYVLPLVAVGGRALFYKGPEAEAELEEAAHAIAKLGGKPGRVVALRLPSGDERRLIVVEKARKTPAQYPRREAVLRAQPIG
nr:16S rRNA (guanine(527)-N(7))-methyltransferase RsmG [bacterium]